MKFIGLEKTLLEYFKTTDQQWKYSVNQVDTLPDTGDIRSVVINGIHIQFCEVMHIKEAKSQILWRYTVG